MPNILIVDDSAIDRALAGKLLQREEDVVVTFAMNGREALVSMANARPDVVVSDLQMPEMNGLELVAAVRRDYPSVPVILMTGRGSESIAADALRIGAAGYVPKLSLAERLPLVVRGLFAATEADRLHSRLFHSLQRSEFQFRLRNDPELFNPLVERIQETLRCLPLGDESERLRVSVAVRHAMWIAHFNGNLELPIDATLSDSKFYLLANERRSELPMSQRCIDIRVVIDPDQAIFHVLHEGPGIDMTKAPENLELAAADRSWLAGFVMMPAVMDDVEWSADGKEISLLKRAVVSEGDEMEMF